MKICLFTFLVLGCLPPAHAKAWRVYAAGPLFNASERNEMKLIADALERADFEVFLPQRDGLEFANVLPLIVQAGFAPEVAVHMLSRAINALDTYQVISTDALVMNLNGRVPDEGSVAEMSMAWVLGKPCVIFHDDSRSLASGIHNPLVLGRADFDRVADVDAIGVVLRRKLTSIRSRPLRLAPVVKRIFDDGRGLWDALRTSPRGLGVSQSRVAEFVIARFAGECQDLLAR